MQSFSEMLTRVFMGRVNRIQFLKGNLFIWFIFGSLTFIFLLLTIQGQFPSDPQEIVGYIRHTKSLWILLPIYFLQAIFSIGLSIRRIKDCGFSPMIVVIILFPYMNVLFFLFLLFKKGEPSTNQYGSAPSSKRDTLSIILNN